MAMEPVPPPLVATPTTLPCSRAFSPVFVLHLAQTPTNLRLDRPASVVPSLAAVPVLTGARASVGLLSSSSVESGRHNRRRSPSVDSAVASSSNLPNSTNKLWGEVILGDHLVSTVVPLVEAKRLNNNSNSNVRTYGKASTKWRRSTAGGLTKNEQRLKIK